MFVLFWVLFALQGLNSLLRPIAAQIQLEEEGDFFTKTFFILDLGGHGKAVVSEKVAERWSGRVEVDEQLLAELEDGRRRYKVLKQRGAV
jgi:hypothetical protein